MAPIVYRDALLVVDDEQATLAIFQATRRCKATLKVVRRPSRSSLTNRCAWKMASGSLLVVDDEESVAVTMGAILEMDGYQFR